jgi:predicted glycosyl hydrolase (DUF1957 family)
MLVLHAHLPYVRHPDDEDHLEEEWLHEAVLECYLPLLELLERLGDDGVPVRLTLSLTPTLVAMLEDPLLRSRIGRRIDRQRVLAEREVRRTQADSAQHAVARFYQSRLERLGRQWSERYRGELVPAFAALRDRGLVELVASGATHGFLPLLRPSPQAVRAQVAVGAAEHARAFGRPASGFWLPECGYTPGLERVLADEELRFTFLDAHGLADAEPRPLLSVHGPAFTASGVAVYARDPEASEQVWSAEVGYPADPVYRDFYRDIGWDLPEDALVPVVGPGRPRRATGFKYHRITGRGAEKAIWAAEPAFARAKSTPIISSAASRSAPWRWWGGWNAILVVAPYDAELFGHWCSRARRSSRRCSARPPRGFRWHRRTTSRPGPRRRSSPGGEQLGSTDTPRWARPGERLIPGAVRCAQMLAPFARLGRVSGLRGALWCRLSGAAPRPVVGLRLHPPERDRDRYARAACRGTSRRSWSWSAQFGPERWSRWAAGARAAAPSSGPLARRVRE